MGQVEQRSSQPGFQSELSLTGSCKRDKTKRNGSTGSRKLGNAKRNNEPITGSRKQEEAKRNSDSIGSRKQQGAKHNSTKTGPGVSDPRMSISHIASSNKRWYEQDKEAPVSTPKARNNITFRQAPRLQRGVSIIDRPSKAQKKRAFMSVHREDEQLTQHDHEVSRDGSTVRDARSVRFVDDVGVNASEGMNEYPKASDLTINLWLRELGGSWAAAANKNKRQEKGTSRDHPPELVEPKK